MWPQVPTYASFVTCGILQLQVTKSNLCGSLDAWEQRSIIIVTITMNKEAINALPGSAKAYTYVTLSY